MALTTARFFTLALASLHSAAGVVLPTHAPAFLQTFQQVSGSSGIDKCTEHTKLHEEAWWLAFIIQSSDPHFQGRLDTIQQYKEFANTQITRITDDPDKKASALDLIGDPEKTKIETEDACKFILMVSICWDSTKEPNFGKITDEAVRKKAQVLWQDWKTRIGKDDEKMPRDSQKVLKTPQKENCFQSLPKKNVYLPTLKHFFHLFDAEDKKGVSWADPIFWGCVIAIPVVMILAFCYYKARRGERITMGGLLGNGGVNQFGGDSNFA